MPNRREFLQAAGAAALSGAVPAISLATDQPRVSTRFIPNTDEKLPVIGLGNSNAFRQGDVELSRQIIELLLSRGGAYIDCGGPSRFTVGQIAGEIAAGPSLFLGTYFSDKESVDRADADRILALTGREQLDLMHSYPEHAEPNWDKFRKFKDEGLTRYIGIARHRKEFYDTMIEMMNTGTVDFLQVNYSLVEPEAEERVLPTAADRGVAVTINRPFINGEYFSIVRGHELPEWAAEFDCDSWAQFSLKFILSHPAVNTVLTETANPKHAVDNLGAGVGRLPDEAMREKMRKHFQSII
jgi:diketogulonate reductase-like aldo/keto reductase